MAARSTILEPKPETMVLTTSGILSSSQNVVGVCWGWMMICPSTLRLHYLRHCFWMALALGFLQFLEGKRHPAKLPEEMGFQEAYKRAIEVRIQNVRT